jgi:hypothetical protein
MFKIEITDPSLGYRLKRNLDRMVDRLGIDLYNEIRARTPVNSGRAKAGWNKTNNQAGFVIENNVPYIGILDRGRHITNRGMRGSLQAPKGIVGPSLKTIKGKN